MIFFIRSYGYESKEAQIWFNVVQKLAMVLENDSILTISMERFSDVYIFKVKFQVLKAPTSFPPFEDNQLKVSHILFPIKKIYLFICNENRQKI